MQSKPLLDKLQGLRPEMVAALGELVRRESPSTHKPLLDALASDLAERFAALGAEVTRLDGHAHGDHVRAVFPAGDGAQPEDGKPGPGLLLCHYDTVWSPGTLGKMPFRVDGPPGLRAWRLRYEGQHRDGRIRRPGSCALWICRCRAPWSCC